MGKQLPEQILTFLSEHTDGCSMLEIRAALATKVTPRSLQRHMQTLIAQGHVIRQGRGKGTRYWICDSTAELPQTTKIRISKKGEEIQNMLSKPLSQKKAVHYNKAFLYDYVPNENFYLEPDIREHLKKIGKQPDSNKPAASFANQILNRLLVDLSWNSSRLEGNTYSLLDTQRLVELGQEAEGKKAFETRMILNHKAAIEFLVELGDELNINRYVILNLHALLSYNLLGNPAASGQLRSIPVSIGKTPYQPLKIPQLVEEYFLKILKTASNISDPFEQSFFLMVHLPYLQPFIDVNKRVSRLAANIPLIKHNYCPISFIDVSQKAYIDGILGVYELNKTDLLLDVFVWAYERSTLRYSETRAYLTEPDAFIERYHNEINIIVREVILNKSSKKQASKTIETWTKENIVESDQPRFTEVVETELLALHEGNIAKYKIKPGEFCNWQKVWSKKNEK